MSPRILGLVSGVVFTFAASSLGAAEKFDLERVEPVPAGEPIPIQDFFRPSLFSSPALNPSGTHLAARVTGGEDRYALMIYDLETKKMETAKGGGERDVGGFRWLTDDRLAAVLVGERRYGMALMGLKVGSGGRGYPMLQYTRSLIVGVPRNDRTRPLIHVGIGLEDGAEDSGVSRVNAELDTGSFVNLTSADRSMADLDKAKEGNRRNIVHTFPIPDEGKLGAYYLADKDGELAFCFTGAQGLQKLHFLREGRWVQSPIDLEVVDIVAAGNRAGELVARTPESDGGTKSLRFVDAATGQHGAVILRDKEYDVHPNIYRDPLTGEIIGMDYHGRGPKMVWFDDAHREVQKKIDTAFPGLVARVEDEDEKGRFLVGTYSDRQPIIYYRVDLEKRAIGLIKNSKPWIDPNRMQPMNVVKFKTRDGKQLDAYLTLPAGASKKAPPPLVVLPHGGPWARDAWGFSAEVQFLASRGYAVLQPNYRGSTGYDWMFTEMDLFAFRQMHDDVTDATKMLVASGFVDAERVAIMGSSFGAYLALSGVAHEPDIYRCAVTIAGVFDWETVLAEERRDSGGGDQYEYLKRKLGDPRKEREKFAAISPLRFVNQVRAPVFVWHGKQDWIASIRESRQLISELKKHDVPHEALIVSGEGHGSAHLKNQIELYRRVEAFLAKNLVPRKAGTTAAGMP